MNKFSMVTAYRGAMLWRDSKIVLKFNLMFIKLETKS